VTATTGRRPSCQHRAAVPLPWQDVLSAADRNRVRERAIARRSDPSIRCVVDGYDTAEERQRQQSKEQSPLLSRQCQRPSAANEDKL
jgi:hypothetical protein